MTEPLIFYISRYEIADMGIALPNGKRISLSRGDEYKTSDPEEIAFLTDVKGLGARKMDDAEFRGWATTQFDNLPTIDRLDIKTVKDVETHLWTSSFEKIIISFLKTKGWIVTKTADEPTESEEPKAKTVAAKKPPVKKKTQTKKGA